MVASKVTRSAAGKGPVIRSDPRNIPDDLRFPVREQQGTLS